MNRNTAMTPAPTSTPARASGPASAGTLLWWIPAVLAGVALVAGALVRPTAMPNTAAPVRAPLQALVCLVPKGQQGTLQLSGASGQAGGAPGWKVSTLDGKAVASGQSSQVAVDQSMVVTPTEQAAAGAGVEIVRGAARSWVQCTVPAVDGALVVPDPTSAVITLANADQGDAVVDLTLLGPGGQVQAAGARGITVPGHSQHEVPLSVLATKGPVAVLVHASGGRVAAAAQSSGRAPGLAQQVMTPAATSQIFPAVGVGVPGATPQLVLANPNDQQVSANLSAIGVRGRFSPNPGQVVIAARSTAVVDLGAALPKQTSADQAPGIALTSDQPLAASVQVRTASDQAWAEPANTGKQFSARLPSGALHLANPGQRTATITLTEGSRTQKLALQPGVSLTTPITTGQVQLSSDQNVAAVLVAGGGQSMSVLQPVPATPAEQPLRLDPGLGRGQR